MVTAYHAEMQFALANSKPSVLNLTGGVAGSLTHIGYGHGHLGHFLFTDATTGKQYAAAAHDDGNIFIKTSGWAANVPNYAISPSKLSDDLVDVNLGNISSLFANITADLKANKSLPFTTVQSGSTVSVGGAIIQPTTGGIKPAPANLLNSATGGNGGNSPQNGTTEPKKWVMPAIIGGVILVLGGLAYWAFKGR